MQILAKAVRDFADYLDECNGHSDTESGLRILKIGEEFGEAAAAWIAYVGQNPRKPERGSLEDVVNELADVAFTALVAIETLGPDSSLVMDYKAMKIMDRIVKEQ